MRISFKSVRYGFTLEATFRIGKGHAPADFFQTSRKGLVSANFESGDFGTRRQLAGTEGSSSPFWSLDSRFLGFSVGTELKKIEVAGGPAQVLCTSPTAVGSGTWSKDNVILFGANPAALYAAFHSEHGRADILIFPF
jgi:hypothetical protein